MSDPEWKKRLARQERRDNWILRGTVAILVLMFIGGIAAGYFGYGGGYNPDDTNLFILNLAIHGTMFNH